MKKTLGALAMSCALAVGMGMPAFAADTTEATEGENTVPMKTTLSPESPTLQATVPMEIPFAIQGIVPNTVCSDFIPPSKDLKITNGSSAALRLTGVDIRPGADNTNFEVWPITDNMETTPTSDCMLFRFQVNDESNKDKGLTHAAYPGHTGTDNPMARWIIDDDKYRNLADPLTTDTAFDITVSDAQVYVTDASKAGKIKGETKNYFNVVFTLSL